MLILGPKICRPLSWGISGPFCVVSALALALLHLCIYFFLQWVDMIPYNSTWQLVKRCGPEKSYLANTYRFGTVEWVMTVDSAPKTCKSIRLASS